MKLPSPAHAAAWFSLAGPADEALMRKRLLGAVSVAVACHALLLFGLSQARALRVGEISVPPVFIRWVEAPVTAKPDAATPAQAAAPAPTPAAKPRAKPRAEPTARPERAKPIPTPASQQEEQVVAAAPTETATEPAAAASAAASASAASLLPDGQDPLRMLPGSAERIHMLDQLSIAVAADPDAYAVGNALSVPILLPGSEQPQIWRFVVAAEETIKSPAGESIRTLRLVHFSENDKDDKLEVLLVPQLAYRPIQLVVAPPNGTANTYTARSALGLLDRVTGAAPATPR